MAPSATQTIQPAVAIDHGQYKELIATSYVKEIEEKGTANQPKASYPNYLPTWDSNTKFAPLVPFTHHDHGLDADPRFPELLKPNVKTEDLTPSIGTVIHGIQLTSLTPAGKDQLALLTAQRKVLVFRNQEFADLPIREALDYGKYFGRLHVHQTSGCPEGYPEVHLVHRGAGDTSAQQLLATRTSSIAWHSDVTFEEQPPGTTFLYTLDNPQTGGDTLFVNGVEAYRRLSPGFQERLHGLKAVHSGYEQADVSRLRGSITRRDPVAHEHPIVRTHPVTGEKALFVSAQFTRSIVGYKKEESDAILQFLYNHIAFGADFQVRVKWEKGTVVVWDNRLCGHTATLDWENGSRRHLARITPQAERPYETPFEGTH